MKQEIKSFMEGLSELGHTPEHIRARVKDIAESELASRYYSLREELKLAMKRMTIEELKAIVAEMEEGGEQ